MKKGLLLLVFILLLSPTAVLTAEAPGLPSVSDRSELRVTEPVFGGEVHILEAGKGKPVSVLLVHGLGDLAGGTWEMLIPELVRDFHVVAVDLPGFGRSEKRNVLYSPARYAAFLKWVVDRYAPGPLVVVGHSLGGAVALHFAASHPENLQRLILADVAGILHRAVYTKELLGPMLPDLPGPVDLKALLGSIVGRLPSPPLDLDLLLSNEILRGRILGEDPAKIAALALVQADFSPLLGKVKTPTVILWGSDDTVTPLRTGILLEAVLPCARLQVIPQAGHVPMFDQPQLFNRAVQEAIAAREVTPLPMRNDTEDRIGTCRSETGKNFSGPYQSIEIINCSDVRLTDITTGSLVIDRSKVVIEEGEIRSAGVALKVTDSTVTATGLRVEGETAILTSGSSLDLAGVTLTCTLAAVRTVKPSTLLFSVSSAQSPSTRGFLHGIKRLSANEAM